jgi:hypothetical protein
MKKLFLIIAFIFVGCISGQNIRIDQVKELPDTIAYLRNLHAMGDTNTVQAFIRDSLGRFWDSTEVKAAIGDSTTATDARLSDSVGVLNTRIDSVINNLGEGGVDTLTQNITILNYGQFSTPEQYLIYQSDTTVAIQRCGDSVGTRQILLTGQYTIRDSIKWDLAGGEMDIIFAKDAKITSADNVPSTDYYHPIGEIIIINGKRVGITGGELYGYTSATNVFQSVLCIRDIDIVTLKNLTVRRGKYAGTFIVNPHNLDVDNCFMDSSHYANLLIGNSKQSNISKGEYSYAGYDVVANPDTGYGISFIGRYVYPPGSSGNFNNENITVNSVKANYNSRKGVDAHGGQNITFTENKVKGFGSCGIYAVNEDGNTGYEKHVRNVIISNNTVTQDSLWLEGLLGNRTSLYLTTGRTVLDSLYWWNAIQVGDYQSSTTTQMYPSGTFTVQGNTLDSMNSRGARAPLSVFVAITKLVGYPRPQIDAINILNNTILYPNVTTDEFDGEQDAVIYFTNGTVPPRFVNVSGNNIFRDTLQSTANNGIKLAFTNPGSWNLVETNDSLFNQIVNVNNNNVYGYFNYPLFISSNNIKQVTSNNTYNGNRLADMDDAYNGVKKFTFHAVAAGDSITLVDSVKITASLDGMTVYNIKITSSNDVDKGINVYNYIAYAKDTTTVEGNPMATAATIMNESGIGGYTETDRPTLTWRTSGNVGTLKLFDSNSDGYSKYNIEMIITSRNVPYWRSE